MPKQKTTCLIGDIYDSRSCGKMEIIEELPRDAHDRVLKVKFLDTGTIVSARAKAITSGNVRDPYHFMYEIKDKTFNSINYGTFKPIEFIGHDNNNIRLIKIRFDLTGYETIVRYDAMMSGKVKDKYYYDYILPGQIMQSNNYGEFEIIEHLGIINSYRTVKIRFLHSGSEVIVRYDDARTGEVSDPAYSNPKEARKILGISEINNLERYLFRIWKAMIHRCSNNPAYAGRGVKICEEWYNFEIFKKDIINLPGWQYKLNDPLNYDLDKDLFQFNLPHNKRVYSKNTCIWLHKSLNTILANTQCLNVNVYYDHIYEINNVFYIKTDIPNYFNFGPFFDLNSAINMLNYCYASLGISMQNPIIYNQYYPMNIKQIMNATEDRKILCNVIK